MRQQPGIVGSSRNAACMMQSAETTLKLPLKFKGELLGQHLRLDYSLDSMGAYQIGKLREFSGAVGAVGAVEPN
jgi:hypothetical protein